MKDNPEFKTKISDFKKNKSKEELLELAEKKASMLDIVDRIAARKALDELGIKYVPLGRAKK